MAIPGIAEASTALRAEGRVHVLPAERTSRIWLVLSGAALVAVYAPTLLWLLDRWTMSVWHHAHGLLIPPVVAYFVREELRRHRRVAPGASAWGLVIVIPALALHALDTGMHTQLLSAVSLVLLLPGLSLLFLGVARTRAILFPLALSAFALPIPLTFTEQVHLVLRQIVTAGTVWLLPFLNIPVFVEGTTLYMPAASLVIGDACSGFSTLYASIAVAFLTAYACPVPGRRVLVLLSAIPLAIAANIVRVTALVVLVVWQGSDVLGTWLHPVSGMMTFALALPVIFWIGRSERPLKETR